MKTKYNSHIAEAKLELAIVKEKINKINRLKDVTKMTYKEFCDIIEK